ncbi:MAG: NAD(P)-binding protein [Gammaproteobacteria bacterium]|jgi:predicted NAD/FAD-binding protein|nr:NAD(P)-binding protein [Gammaproteobacteria bacterium]
MKIAIIGSGIAGNVTAYHLNKEHDITLFEQNTHVGGHTHTHSIFDAGKELNIDTGFIVLNDRTYPNFMRLLNELDVDIQKTEMSFSVKCEQTALEYNGNNLNTLFAQRSNILKPAFYQMIADILRFNREASASIEVNNTDLSLGDFLQAGNYSDIFINKYIVPMGAAIWSTRPQDMFSFPASFFFRFFLNHGLLSINDRPQWYVIKGGSHTYVKKLISGFEDSIRIGSTVDKIVRFDDHVEVHTRSHDIERFDYVFIAAHSDQALNMLQQPSALERATLSAIQYQKNEAVLHTDESLLPIRKKAWASWNYHIPQQPRANVALTYNMNILQGLRSNKTYCVTLNYTDQIAQQNIIRTIEYHHPVFTPESIIAQQNHRLINGTGRTYYCGAYWRNGFHEDGVVSALNALSHFKQDISNEEKLSLRWAS